MSLKNTDLQDLLSVTSGIGVAYKAGKSLEQRLTGRFYTHERIGKAMALDIARRFTNNALTDIKLIDPFCGDGRLICWVLDALKNLGWSPRGNSSITLWDCDESSVRVAELAIAKSLSIHGLNSLVKVESLVADTFTIAPDFERLFDICVTNPPWETIKPDPRELTELDENTKEKYLELLKNKVYRLERVYPHSKCRKNFSGWGANLARFGIEASVKLVKQGGIFGLVAPASIFGDQISAPLRTWLFQSNAINTIDHYPAEARLFDGVDQDAVYFVGEACRWQDFSVPEKRFMTLVQHSATTCDKSAVLEIDSRYLESHDFAIGFTGSEGMGNAMKYLLPLKTLGEFERGERTIFRLGRELDETRISEKLTESGDFKFLKGRQVKRFDFEDTDSKYLKKEIKVPDSANLNRLIWRDVSRQSATRRMIAAELPPGYATGNSLNVLIPKKQNDDLIRALLGLFNSVVFEAQVRSSISTNHLSVGAIRKIRVPELTDTDAVLRISSLVQRVVASSSLEDQSKLEVAIAEWYGLPDDIYLSLLDQLEKNAPADVAGIRKCLLEKRQKNKDD